MSKIGESLSAIKIGEPQTHNNMKVYPLHIQNGHERGYQTLDEAMAAGTFEVKEVSEGGSVPTLAVSNTGKSPVLLVVGEELIGAKQNRVLNTTLLIPAESELEVPVSCVERGRWAYTSRAFSSSTGSSHSFLRLAQTENVTKRLRTHSLYDADQSAVWGEVDRKISTHRSSSSTSALHDVYEQTENQLKEYIDAFKVPEAEGILVVINGQIVGADLFDHTDTMRELCSKLLRSYALDALERKNLPPAKESSGDTQQFLDSTQKAAEESYDSVGLGKDVRLTGEQVTGSCLLWKNKPIHTCLFKSEKQSVL